MTFTPGPWSMRPVVGVEPRESSADVHGVSGGFVADCGSHTEANANARLIAAAPDLLVTLRDLCDAIPELTLADDPPLRVWVKAATAAIAKAEGR